MNKIYTGIGSRNTPNDVLVAMYKIGRWLAFKGYTLRSGGAKGADSAFEQGCDNKNGNKEIYMPWSGFEGNLSKLIVRDEKAFSIAKQYHPYWHNLTVGARKLQARNSHQVLGRDLNTPTDFILCYTKNGEGAGGTGQAIRIAKAHNIPIFDFGKYQNINMAREGFKEFCTVNNIIGG